MTYICGDKVTYLCGEKHCWGHDKITDTCPKRDKFKSISEGVGIMLKEALDHLIGQNIISSLSKSDVTFLTNELCILLEGENVKDTSRYKLFTTLKERVQKSLATVGFTVIFINEKNKEDEPVSMADAALHQILSALQIVYENYRGE